MKVTKKTSRAGMTSHRLFSGWGKNRVKKKITSLGLTALMVVNTIFATEPTTAVAATATTRATSDLQDGLIGYYTFDNTLENAVSGGGSATLHGGAGADTWNSPATGTATYAAGKNGKAYEFSGDVDGVRGEGLTLDVTTKEAFTISMWVNTKQKINFQPIIFTNIDGDNYISVATQFNDFASGALIMENGWGGNVWWLDKNSTACVSDVQDLSVGIWTYVTLTMTKEGVASLYYDGKLLAQSETAAAYYKNLPIFLGVNWWNESFAGMMDDVAVYNKALSATEVEALYGNNGIPGSDVVGSVTPTHVSVHDPSIVKDEKTGMYYVFGSHMAWAKSSDLIHWEAFENNINREYDTIFAEDAAWSALGGTQGNAKYEVKGNLWAPDVIWNEEMNKWCMYMSVNGDYWYTSVVLLTADSLDGDWTRVGPVVYSGFTNSTEAAKTDYSKVMGSNDVAERYLENRNGSRTYGMNAIDPCVLYDDDGNLWMTYGSWFGGIYMLKLDKNTGFRDYNYTYTTEANVSDQYQGLKIAGGQHVSGEASYIQKIGNYWYLFMTNGELIATGGYNMRVFRSADITGPYVDYSGDDARYTTAGDNFNGKIGNRVMSGYQWSYMSTGYVAQGHNSAFVDDDGKAYVIYHTRFNDGTEGHEVRVHQMFVNEDGWLVTAPFEYTGETLSSDVTKEEVAGAYEVLFHRLNIDYRNLEVVTGENLTFNADGTITGDRTGTWEFSSKGAPYVTMKIGNYTYKGVFLKQQMENSTDITWTFTVLGNDEISVWGYKYVGDGEELAKKAAENLVMPQGTFVDLELPAKGINNSTITWSSSNKTVLADDGKITIPDTDTKVTLTGTFTVQGVSVTKDYPITVYSPQTDKENKVLATYFTGEKKDLTNAEKGTYQYANPFYDGTTKGLEMYNGVSIKFDVEATSGADQWLTDIIGFNTGNVGGLFFEGNSYLGYNGSGGFFDANLKNGDFAEQAWQKGTDFIKDSASVELRLLPSGFEVYVNDVLAYNQDSIESYQSGKTEYVVPGSIANISNFSSVIDYLQNTANYLNFGWGSFWEGGYKGTISNVELSVLPVEVIDTTGYLYYENYNKLAGKTGNATGWISGNASGSLSVKTDDEHKGYLNFAVGGDSGNRGAYTLFDEKAQVSGEYVIELDTSLTAGVLTQRSVSEFSILGTDATDYKADNAVSSGYILKLKNEPPAGTAANQNNYTNQTKWYINDSDETVTIPVGTWVHIKASVNTEDKTVAFTITNNTTNEVIYNGIAEINGSGTLAGLHLLRGRGVGTASIDNIAVHTHNWGTGEVTKPESCSEEGERTYTCSVCGETKTETIEKSEHTKGASTKENVKEAACGVDGSYDEVFYCVVCKEEISRETKTVPALKHIPGEPEETERVDPTQETDGYYIEVIKCILCHEVLSSDKFILPSLNHNWDEGEITKEPTCTERGVKTHYCTDEDCDIVWNEPIAALGHNWDEGEITQQPTCTEKGVMTYHCTRCDETKTESIDVLAHQPGEAQRENEIPATCFEGGRYEEVIRCEIGGEIISKEIKYTNALGHDWDEGTITKAPTCTETGEITYTCTRCDETETEILAALGHNWDEGTITKAPTCTETGEITYTCTRCDETETETLAALGHDWDEGTVTKAPTCTEAGEITYTCANCGDTKTEAIAALGHDWHITDQQDASCEEDGWIEYTCANCGDTKRESIPAVGHSYGAPKFKWVGDDFATASFTCTVCGNVQTIEAEMESTTKDGAIIYTATVEMEGQIYTSKKQIISLEETDDMRVVISDEFEEIPETLGEIGITSEQNIAEILKQTVIENGYTDEKGYIDDNFVLHDVVLQILEDDGTWKTVTPEDFPEEGITITIPYPEGTNRLNYDFVVTHMLTIEMNGYMPGDVEILDATKTDTGLQVTVTSLSPIAVSWTKLNDVDTPDNTNTPDDTDTPDDTNTPDDTKNQDNNGTSNDANTPDTKKDSTSSSSDTAIVKTGDETDILRLLLCGVVSLALLLATGLSNRKKAKH